MTGEKQQENQDPKKNAEKSVNMPSAQVDDIAKQKEKSRIENTNQEIDDEVEQITKGETDVAKLGLKEIELKKEDGFHLSDNGGIFRTKYASKHREDGLKEKFKLDNQLDSIDKIKQEFKLGTTVDIDFGGDQNAEWHVGAGDILPAEIRIIVVRDKDGKERIGIRKSKGVDKVGYYDEKGYIPVFSGYQIYIPMDQDIKEKYNQQLSTVESTWTEEGSDTAILPKTKAGNFWSVYWTGEEDELEKVKNEERQTKNQYWGEAQNTEQWEASYSKGDKEGFDKYVEASVHPKEGPKDEKALEKPEFLKICEEMELGEKDYKILFPLLQAFALKESGDTYNIIGGIPTKRGRAIGKYQIMPREWKDWSKKYCGGDVVYPSPRNQDLVAFKQMAAYYKEYKGESEYDIVQCIAARWCGNMNGGRIETVNDISETVASWGESPLDYSYSLLEKYKTRKKILMEKGQL